MYNARREKVLSCFFRSVHRCTKPIELISNSPTITVMLLLITWLYVNLSTCLAVNLFVNKYLTLPMTISVSG